MYNPTYSAFQYQPNMNIRQQEIQNSQPTYSQQFSIPNAVQNNVNWIPVSGIEGAKNHIVQPNCTAWLMDNNESKFYVKSADSLGVTTLKAYQFNEIPTTQNIGTSSSTDYATKEDINQIKQDLDKIIEQKINDLAKLSMEE